MCPPGRVCHVALSASSHCARLAVGIPRRKLFARGPSAQRVPCSRTLRRSTASSRRGLRRRMPSIPTWTPSQPPCRCVAHCVSPSSSSAAGLFPCALTLQWKVFSSHIIRVLPRSRCTSSNTTSSAGSYHATRSWDSLLLQSRHGTIAEVNRTSGFAQITDVADSQAGEQNSWQNGGHQESERMRSQGQQHVAKDRAWQPPARSAAWGMRVSAADIDLNSLQYVGELPCICTDQVPGCTHWAHPHELQSECLPPALELRR